MEQNTKSQTYLEFERLRDDFVLKLNCVFPEHKFFQMIVMWQHAWVTLRDVASRVVMGSPQAPCPEDTNAGFESELVLTSLASWLSV